MPAQSIGEGDCVRQETALEVDEGEGRGAPQVRTMAPAAGQPAPKRQAQTAVATAHSSSSIG